MVVISLDKNCTAFCERKIRFLSQEDQTTSTLPLFKLSTHSVVVMVKLYS